MGNASSTASAAKRASIASPSSHPLSLSRLPSIRDSSHQATSAIPEEVAAAHDPANTPSKPILVRPRLPTMSALHDATSVGSSASLTGLGPHADYAHGVGSANGRNSHSAHGKDSLASTGRTLTPDHGLNLDDMIQRLLEAGYSQRMSKSPPLKNAEIMALCQVASELFLAQPTLIELSPPVKIIGDIHGQYHDLLRLFEMCGYPPHENYLMLGDYVDRGKQSLETILLLLCYKLKFPDNFFLLRGNHECANVTRVYGFYDECKRRCNVKIWKAFVSVFDTLPVAAIVAGKIFCVHGGLSPDLKSLDEIRNIERPTQIPDRGILNDLLWSDPSDTAYEWEENERGVSYCFGKKAVTNFLQRYDLDLICRAHMVVEDGYEFFGDERKLVTLFSAPNYCGEFDNYGAVMGVSSKLMCSFELLKPKEEEEREKANALGGSSGSDSSPHSPSRRIINGRLVQPNRFISPPVYH